MASPRTFACRIAATKDACDNCVRTTDVHLLPYQLVRPLSLRPNRMQRIAHRSGVTTPPNRDGYAT